MFYSLSQLQTMIFQLFNTTFLVQGPLSIEIKFGGEKKLHFVLENIVLRKEIQKYLITIL